MIVLSWPTIWSKQGRTPMAMQLLIRLISIGSTRKGSPQLWLCSGFSYSSTGSSTHYVSTLIQKIPSIRQLIILYFVIFDEYGKVGICTEYRGEWTVLDVLEVQKSMWRQFSIHSLIVSAAQRRAVNNFAVTCTRAWIRVHSSIVLIRLDNFSCTRSVLYDWLRALQQSCSHNKFSDWPGHAKRNTAV